MKNLFNLVLTSLAIGGITSSLVNIQETKNTFSDKIINNNNNCMLSHKSQTIQQTTWEDPKVFFQYYNSDVYIGADNGLYEANNGTTFKRINLSGAIKSEEITESNNVTSITASPTHQIYVGTKQGVFVSNNGTNFHIIPSLKNVAVYGNGITVAKNNNIYVSTFDGLYYAQNGSDFQKIIFTKQPNIPFFTKQVANGDIYLATNAGVYITTNGTTFNFVKSVEPYNIYGIDQTKNGDIYISTADGLYKSSDGVNFKVLWPMGGKSIFSFTENVNGNIYVGTSIWGIYQSTTKGKTFYLNPTIPADAMVNSLNFTNNGNVYAAISDKISNGLYVTTNGTNFIKISSVPNVWIAGIYKTKKDALYVFAPNHVFYSTDGNKFIRL